MAGISFRGIRRGRGREENGRNPFRFERGLVVAHPACPNDSPVRKISFGQGVERIFHVQAKVIDKVELLRSSKVRRARLFYLRGLRGKAARLRDVEKA
jgi:large subunit ribosomal protein L19